MRVSPCVSTIFKHQRTINVISKKQDGYKYPHHSSTGLYCIIGADLVFTVTSGVATGFISHLLNSRQIFCKVGNTLSICSLAV